MLADQPFVSRAKPLAQLGAPFHRLSPGGYSSSLRNDQKSGSSSKSAISTRSRFGQHADEDECAEEWVGDDQRPDGRASHLRELVEVAELEQRRRQRTGDEVVLAHAARAGSFLAVAFVRLSRDGAPDAHLVHGATPSAGVGEVIPSRDLGTDATRGRGDDLLPGNERELVGNGVAVPGVTPCCFLMRQCADLRGGQAGEVVEDGVDGRQLVRVEHRRVGWSTCDEPPLRATQEVLLHQLCVARVDEPLANGEQTTGCRPERSALSVMP